MPKKNANTAAIICLVERPDGSLEFLDSFLIDLTAFFNSFLVKAAVSMVLASLISAASFLTTPFLEATKAGVCKIVAGVVSVPADKIGSSAGAGVVTAVSV